MNDKLTPFLNSAVGATGELFRSIDWSKHPLGPVEIWPASLKTALGILFHSRHPMFIWWGSELYQFYNEAYLPSIGRNKHPTAMGQKGKDCWPEIWPIIGPQIEGVMSRGEATWHEDQLVPIFRNSKLEDVYWTYGYSPIFTENGEIGGVLVVCNETTKQVLAEQELRRSGDNLRSAITARDTFLGVASHELYTPLTSIKLQAEMSKRIVDRKGFEGMSPEKFHKLIDTTLVQTDRLSRLVNDMLDVTRINSGEFALNLAPENISILVEDVIERFTPQFENAGCTLTKKIAADIKLPMDSMRIEQVLTNFITNALKYAPGKPIHVEVSVFDNFARVSIQDEGRGISLEHQKRIFGRFERAVGSQDATGLGLGLYICKKIIEGHQGRIYVESRLSKGSKFIFDIPLEKINCLHFDISLDQLAKGHD